MNKKKMSMICALLLGIGCLFAGCQEKELQMEKQEASQSGTLVSKPMKDNGVGENPYLAKNESLLHHDTYNSDVTHKILPMGIYPEITASEETVLINCVSCFFYDDYGNCYTPYSVPTENGMSTAGIAIRDVDAKTAETLGSFLPHRDDPGETYGVQNSYAFIDQQGYAVCPTNHGHVILLKSIDENGEVLSTFEKLVDINVLEVAFEVLGDDISPNLMSIMADYEGNIWFATGGFRMDPQYAQDGFFGYIERECIDRCLAGENFSHKDYIHVQRLGKGENVENGICSHELGCVFLTNQNCYLAKATEQGAEVVWKTPYVAGKGDQPDESKDARVPGAGMAWGSGATPTLTNDFVFFTDNDEEVSLIALDIETGEVVAKEKVFQGMEDLSVGVENSLLVYSSKADTASVVVCNWFGAGSASLYTPEADSTIQLFSNLYDTTWIQKGSDALMPGVERKDIVKDKDGYKMETVWLREDLCSTCMFKLSTANGYIYGYTEVDGMWQYLVLDWDTGETVLSVPVSELSRFNNLGSGMMQGNDGNSLYSPTNNRQLLCLHDRFAYLPEKSFVDLDIFQLDRYFCDKEALEKAAGKTMMPATYLHSAFAENILEPTMIAYRVNGLEGKVADYQLLLQTVDGSYKIYDKKWSITKDGGEVIEEDASLNPESIYEIRFYLEDASEYDLCEDKGAVKTAIVLGK